MANRTKLEVTITEPKTTPAEQKPTNSEKTIIKVENNSTKSSADEAIETIVAEAPNTGFNLPAINPLTERTIIAGGFCFLVLLALLIRKLWQKSKAKSSLIKPISSKEPSKLSKLLPILSLLFFATSLYFDTFATDSLTINVYPSRNVSFEADTIGTNEIKYVHDQIYVPSIESELAISVYSENSALLKNTANSSVFLSSIKSPGKLGENEFGFTLEEPKENTIWQPIGDNINHPTTLKSLGSKNVIDIYYGVRASSIKAGQYNINLNFSVTPANNVYMQDMSSSICTPLAEGETFTLKDIRDNKEYTVAKLEDGNCWMTSDLALELEIRDGVVGTLKDGSFVKLTQDNTDLRNSEWRTDETTFIPEEDYEWGIEVGVRTNSKTGERELYSYHESIVEDLYTPRSFTSAENGKTYYNLPAVKAEDLSDFSKAPSFSNGDFETLEVGDSSICPSGWHLPDYSEYDNLIGIYRRKHSTTYEGKDGEEYDDSPWVFSSPLNFGKNGWIYNGTEVEFEGKDWIEHYYLTSDAAISYGDIQDVKIRIDEYEDNIINIEAWPNEYGVGATARCVANYSDTYSIVYDENTNYPVGNFPTRYEEKEIPKDGKITLSDKTPTREGYYFEGWSTSSTGVAEYSAGATFDLTTSFLTLYAIWSEDKSSIAPISPALEPYGTVEIRFKQGSGPTMGVENIPEKVSVPMYCNLKICTIEFTLPSLTPTSNDYIFRGWSLTEKAENPEYSQGDKVSLEISRATDDLNFYAVWEQDMSNAVTIIFESNADGVTNMPDQMALIPSGSMLMFMPKVVPTREGYIFTGWSQIPTANSGCGSMRTPSPIDTICNLMWDGSSSSITLYAIWFNPNAPIPVTYNANADGDYVEVPTPTTATSTQNNYWEFNISDMIPVRKGYTFVRWQVYVPTLIQYCEAGAFCRISYPPMFGRPSSLTLSAVWERNEEEEISYVYVYFEPNADDNYVNSMPYSPRELEITDCAARCHANINFSDLPIPTRKDGYTFLGWSYDETDEYPTFSIEDNKPWHNDQRLDFIEGEDLYLYAIWASPSAPSSTDPLGVIKTTNEDDSLDLSTLLVIIFGSALILLGASAIIILARQNREE